MTRRRPYPYGVASRSLTASYLFLLPLLACYQVGILFDPEARNGAGYIFDRALARFGPWGILIVNLAILGLICFRLMQGGKSPLESPRLFLVMLAESLAWAGFLLVSGKVIRDELLAIRSVSTGLVASAGAGVYEEVLFRFLLMGGLMVLLRKAFAAGVAVALAIAVPLSALLFSAAHHTIGGEPFDRAIFLYRAGMGCVLGLLFHFRGLGIAAYAHAFYNAFLIVRLHA